MNERPNRAEDIRVRPMTACIGAEIDGVDLSVPMDDAAFDVIYRAYLDWKVIFLRDQDITDQQHVAFARRFGAELHHHPIANTVHPEFTELLEIRRGGKVRDADNEFHADVTFEEMPPKCSILRSIEVPEYGGDTIWVNMAAAYESLYPGTKALIKDLHGVHDFGPIFGYRLKAERHAERRQKLPLMSHPVVIRHPETGEKLLFVNANFTTHIGDYLGKLHIGATQALVLFKELLDTVRVPEHQVRFRWTPNAVAVWDNWATQHYAVYDYGDPEAGEVKRVMRRATVRANLRPAA